MEQSMSTSIERTFPRYRRHRLQAWSKINLLQWTGFGRVTRCHGTTRYIPPFYIESSRRAFLRSSAVQFTIVFRFLAGTQVSEWFILFRYLSFKFRVRVTLRGLIPSPPLVLVLPYLWPGKYGVRSPPLQTEQHCTFMPHSPVSCRELLQERLTRSAMEERWAVCASFGSRGQFPLTSAGLYAATRSMFFFQACAILSHRGQLSLPWARADDSTLGAPSSEAWGGTSTAAFWAPGACDIAGACISCSGQSDLLLWWISRTIAVHLCATSSEASSLACRDLWFLWKPILEPRVPACGRHEFQWKVSSRYPFIVEVWCSLPFEASPIWRPLPASSLQIPTRSWRHGREREGARLTLWDNPGITFSCMS